MVKASLSGSYGYRDPVTGARKYYGPGEDIDIPEGLARSLGLDTPEPEDAGVVDYPIGSSLPADFPGQRYLEAAGYTDAYAVKALTYDELVALPGIGKATAKQIIDAIGELE